MPLDDTYRYEIPVTLTLTEIELGALLLPSDQLLEDEQEVYDAARDKAQKILDRAVAERLQGACCVPDCAAAAEYEVIPEGEAEPFKVCQRDLSTQVNGPCEIRALGGAAE